MASASAAATVASAHIEELLAGLGKDSAVRLGAFLVLCGHRRVVERDEAQHRRQHLGHHLVASLAVGGEVDGLYDEVGGGVEERLMRERREAERDQRQRRQRVLEFAILRRDIVHPRGDALHHPVEHDLAAGRVGLRLELGANLVQEHEHLRRVR